tara:strand:- start:461 stop:664 length:204 start_codon:yes stop_codon:yes gene_type:complete
MSKNQKNIEEILIKGLSHILKRTIKVNSGDQLAIAQEYKEWINCVSANDFSKQEILVIDKYTFYENK